MKVRSQLRSKIIAVSRVGTNLLGLFGLSYFVPKQKNLLLFGDGHKMFMGNSKYLFLECLAHDHLECYFVTNNPEAVRALEGIGQRPLDNNSFETFWKILRARYIFVNGVTGDVSVSHFLGRFSIVNLWHGMPIKKILLDDDLSPSGNPKGLIEHLMHAFSKIELKQMKYIICTNRLMEEFMRTAFKNRRTVTTGYPRNDYLFSQEAERARILEEIGVIGARKVFLYAPTFRDSESGRSSPFDTNFLLTLDYHLEKTESVFLIKRHPFSGAFLSQSYKRILDVTNMVPDIQKLLLAADVLISDYSSVVFDFTIQEKPIIFYVYDLEGYQAESRKTYFDLTEELPGPFCRTQEELLQTMNNIDAIFSDSEYRNCYDRYNAQFNEYKDAGSSRRIMKMLGLLDNTTDNGLSHKSEVRK